MEPVPIPLWDMAERTRSALSRMNCRSSMEGPRKNRKNGVDVQQTGYDTSDGPKVRQVTCRSDEK